MNLKSYGRLAAAALLLSAHASWAQTWPSRPIHVVVPFAVGTGVDLAVRALAGPLNARLGTPIVVENRPGASTAIGNQYVAKAKPDGYTVLATAGSIISNAAVFQQDDPTKPFEPVVLLTEAKNCFVVNAKSPARSVKDIEKMAMAQPGKLFYSSGGTGVVHHLAMALFQSETGTNIVHVPHKGATEALQSVIAGRTEMMILPITTANSYVKNGQIRMLATVSKVRSRLYPDIPTMPEEGYPGVTYDSYYLVLAPAGTPVPIVDRLNREFNAALVELNDNKTLDKLGLEIVGGTSRKLGSLLKEELVRMRKLVADAKIKPE